MNKISAVANELELRSGVYYIKGHKPFHYNDGDSVENYIQSVIEGASDISSNSRELEQGILDWPSLYHFSRKRCLAYKSLNLPKNGTVLEVGCGCGAITRYLGENVADVLALEGSSRRASITRSRTRDLKSVNVLCASFQDVIFAQKFDVIICNGVLEYAPLFVDADDPANEFIKLLASLLKPDGKLVIAIENKFGLRYFASGREEHTDIMFDGLEGYPRKPKGPATFGLHELHKMLEVNCGFVETLLPLPDYKLPTALIRAELLNEVNCADLIAGSLIYDFGTNISPLMHERLVLHELQKNQSLKMFSNSYFLISGPQNNSLLNPNWMGDKYSINRNASKSIFTEIIKNDNGFIEIIKKLYEPQRPPDQMMNLTHSLCRDLWIDGVSMHTLMARSMLMADSRLEAKIIIKKNVDLWWRALRQFGLQNGKFSGDSLDCIWQNAIVKNNEIFFIDKEWILNEGIDPITIIYRSVDNFIATEKFYFKRWPKSSLQLSPYKLIINIAAIVGVKCSLRLLIKAINVHFIVLDEIYGSRLSATKKLYRVLIKFTELFIPFSWYFFIGHIMTIKVKIISKVKNIFRIK